jgi:hypothetical protein
LASAGAFGSYRLTSGLKSGGPNPYRTTFTFCSAASSSSVGWHRSRTRRTASIRAWLFTSSLTVMLSDRSMPTSRADGIFGSSCTPTLGRTAVSRVTARASRRRVRTVRIRLRVAAGWPRYVQTVNRTSRAATTPRAGSPTG